MNADKTLREHLRDYYAERSLPPEVAADLKARIALGAAASEEQASAGAPRPAAPTRARRLAAAVAAAIAVAALAWLVAAQRDATVARRAAREIAGNHHKGLAAEVATDRYRDLARLLDRLDFTPIEPRALAAEGLEPVGARYCSVQGVLAVQIRLRDGVGRRHTLYEARLVPPLDRIDAREVEVDGVRVRLWREGGLLLGLASPLSPSSE